MLCEAEINSNRGNYSRRYGIHSLNYCTFTNCKEQIVSMKPSYTKMIASYTKMIASYTKMTASYTKMIASILTKQ